MFSRNEYSIFPSLLQQRIDTYFSRVNDIIKKGKTSSRIKFALQDVVELRNNKWVPRQLQDTKLKTIDQIHREAEDEEQLTKQLASQYTGNSGMPPYGRRDSRPSSMEDKRGGRGGQKPGEEWSKVGGEKRVQQTSRPDLDRIRSMKKEKESSGGLRAVSKWGVGSKVAGTSGAAAEVQKPVEKQLSKPPGRSVACNMQTQHMRTVQTVNPHTNMHMQTHANTYTHTRVHTYTHMHTHTIYTCI